MSNHPNRSPADRWYRPAADEIRAARIAAGLTQTAAGELVCSPLRTWQAWESGDRPMPPMAWELFTLKVACIVTA